MKEGKKPTPRKTSNNRSTPKRTNYNRQTHNKSYNKQPEKPTVKDVVIEENFLDEEETDKRLVVFAVIAVLVILATIVTLVIGCDKKKEEDTKKPVDDIVIPEKKEDKEEDEGVDTKEIVRKVTSVYRGKKTKESDSNKSQKKTDEVVEDKTYNVTYYLQKGDTFEEVENVDVTEGNKAESLVPSGYTSCNYYTKQELEELFDLDQVITEDVNIYMTCSLIEYTIVYDKENTYPTTYTVEDNDIELNNDNYEGWYTENTFENKVEVINKDLVNKAVEENEKYYIYLFAKEACEGDTCNTETTTPITDNPVNGDALVCEDENCTLENEEKTICEGEECSTTTEVETTEPVNEENTLCEEGECELPIEPTEVEEEQIDETEVIVPSEQVETIEPTSEENIETVENTEVVDNTPVNEVNNTEVVTTTEEEVKTPKTIEPTRETEPKGKEENKKEEKPNKVSSDEKKPEEEKTVEETPTEEVE